MDRKRERKQAGAELCQAQEKLGLAKPDLPVVVFHLKRNLGPLPFAKNINHLLFDNKFAKNRNCLLFDNNFAKNRNRLLFDNKLRMSSNKLRSYFIFQKLRLASI